MILGLFLKLDEGRDQIHSVYQGVLILTPPSQMITIAVVYTIIIFLFHL